MIRLAIIAYGLIVVGGTLAGVIPRITTQLSLAFMTHTVILLIFAFYSRSLTARKCAELEMNLKPALEKYRELFGNNEDLKSIASDKESKLLTNLLTSDGISELIIDLSVDAIKNIFENQGKNKEQVLLEQKIIDGYIMIKGTRSQFRIGLYIAAALSIGTMIITI